MCSQLQLQQVEWIASGLHFSIIWTPQVIVSGVCALRGWDGGYVLEWVEYWAVCEGVVCVLQWERTRKKRVRVREEVMKGESKGREIEDHFDDVNFGFISQMV